MKNRSSLLNKIRNILFVVFAMAFSDSKASPITHTVTYNVTTHVTCNIGDTLKFFGTFSGDYVVATQSGTNVISNIFPTMVNAAPFYIGYIVITGTETSFFFSEISQGPVTGTITINQTTGISTYANNPSIKVFPNPFTNEIKVTVTTKTVITIMSIDGTLISSNVLLPGETSIHLTRLPAGLYLMQTNSGVFKIYKE